jgi:preprotein translocase subunit YajC
MNLFYLPLLMGAPAGGEGSSGSSMLSFLPLVAIIAIFYFLILRPQNRKQKETQKMLSALKKGDRVVTIGGIHGLIQSVKESTVIVKVDDNVKLEFNRSAISSISSQGREEKEEKKLDAPSNDNTSGTEEQKA